MRKLASNEPCVFSIRQEYTPESLSLTFFITNLADVGLISSKKFKNFYTF